MHIKRILIAVFVILLIFAGCHPRKKTGTMGEVRAAWISYIELSSILDNRSEADYIQGVKTMLENLKAMNFNTDVYKRQAQCSDTVLGANDPAQLEQLNEIARAKGYSC